MNSYEMKFKKITGFNFNHFYLTQKPKLIWYLTKWTKDVEVSEDYADEAFIQALQKIDTYEKDKSKIETWLYTIALNIARKNHQDSLRFQCVSIDKEYNNSSTINMFLPIHESNHDFEMNNEIEKKAEIVKNAINEMTDKQNKYKQVLVMREIDNLTYNEISDCLKINLSTIKSQIKKGREIVVKKVKKKLDAINSDGLL